MFEKYINNYEILDSLISREEYKPFPTAKERDAWESLPAALKQYLISEGENEMVTEWPLLTAVRYMDFVRNGNRSKYQNMYFQRRFKLGTLALAECAEGKGRFLDEIINGIWLICEESSWEIPALLKLYKESVVGGLPDITKPSIELFSAETGSLLSWIYYLLKDSLDGISPVICERIKIEVKSRILDLYLKHNDFWWMGFISSVNNHDPWTNASCLTAFLFTEDDPDRRRQAVIKCMKSLDCYVNPYPEDGGCDEGPAYWDHGAGSLFECLDMLYAVSNGKIDVYSDNKIINMGKFIYGAHVGNNYYVNFADSATSLLGTPVLMYLYGKHTGDKSLIRQGIHSFHTGGKKITRTFYFGMRRALMGVFCYEEMVNASNIAPPLVQDSWFEKIQFMSARFREGYDKGLFLSAKGGHNDEFHNHNDVGHFIIYSNGMPVIIDPGVESYTAKTFSPNRYEIWTMQSAYHNLPIINGIQQKNGSQYTASHVEYTAGDKEIVFSLDIANAYPSESKAENWIRTFRYKRTEEGSEGIIEIEDNFKIKDDCIDGYFELVLMSCIKPNLDNSSGIIDLVSESANPQCTRIEYDARLLDARVETIELNDNKLISDFGKFLYRIILKNTRPVNKAISTIRISQIN